MSSQENSEDEQTEAASNRAPITLDLGRVPTPDNIKRFCSAATKALYAYDKAERNYNTYLNTRKKKNWTEAEDAKHKTICKTLLTKKTSTTQALQLAEQQAAKADSNSESEDPPPPKTKGKGKATPASKASKTKASGKKSGSAARSAGTVIFAIHYQKLQ